MDKLVKTLKDVCYDVEGYKDEREFSGDMSRAEAKALTEAVAAVERAMFMCLAAKHLKENRNG